MGGSFHHGSSVREHVPLGPLTTYKAGGKARWFSEIEDISALEAIVGSGIPEQVDVLVLGRGSNLVVADSGFDGLVLKLSGEFNDVDISNDAVTAGAAVPLPRLARAVVDAGYTGLEFFVGVPGSVGGAVRQNAGCFGTETVDVLTNASLVDLRSGESSTRDVGDLGMSYRTSNVRHSELVTSATFRLEAGDTSAARDRMREITRWRKDNQPGGSFNAGSVFKNPEGGTAGEIIDALGLKGSSVGGVKVSEKHANFFVADPTARASDIAALVDLVKNTVLAETGTILETEIQFVGFEE